MRLQSHQDGTPAILLAADEGDVEQVFINQFAFATNEILIYAVVNITSNLKVARI
jgi:hypothetical protein